MVLYSLLAREYWTSKLYSIKGRGCFSYKDICLRVGQVSNDMFKHPLMIVADRHGIRCNAVLPGFTETPMTAKIPSDIMAKVLLP